MDEDFFEHRYFVLNKRQLSRVGTWPFEDARSSKMKRVIYLTIMISQCIPEVGVASATMFIRLIDRWPDPIAIFAILSNMGIRSIIFVKWYNVVLQPKATHRLLQHMQDDWQSLKRTAETRIMDSYGEFGRKMVTWYSYYIYFVGLSYALLPLSPIFQDFLKPLNESRQKKLPFDAEYFVDPDKYYYHIVCHSFVTTAAYVIVIAAVDSMYMVYANHACSQFAIACDRLENIFESNNNNYGKKIGHNIVTQCNVYDDVVDIIKKHKRAIQFVTFIESAFKASMLLQVMLCVLAMSVTGVLTLLHLDNLDDVLRFGSLALGQACHLFFLNHPGQRVIDHSGRVFESTYTSYWYTCSTRTKTLLRLTLLRSITPCVFTAGKVCVMSMATFLSVIQTTMSYFTVLSSV